MYDVGLFISDVVLLLSAELDQRSDHPMTVQLHLVVIWKKLMKY